MNQIPTGLAAYSITMLILWLFTRKDKAVKENWKKPLGIFVRMAGFFALLHIFLITLPFDVWQSYSVIIFAIAFSFIWQLYDFDLLAVFIIFWLIYQWAFWFPVKNEVILKNEPKQKKKSTVESLPKYGVATTDLKPMGKVEIEGKEHTAISTLGFVSSGDRVLIEGANGLELRVRKETVPVRQ
jgi:membrane-bound ClpP family serine protease